MNNCHSAPVWLVSNRLKAVNEPMRKITSRGPYLSKAQPPKTLKVAPMSINREIIREVAARFKSNSLSIDLKNTPKENCIPARVVPMREKLATITQP